MKNLTLKFIVLSIIVLGFAISLNPAKAEASTEVTLNGEVNPAGVHTTAWFEWGTDYNLNKWNETSHMYIGANNYVMPISAKLSGLSPRETYYFRVVTDNGYKVHKGNILSFTTSDQVVKKTTYSDSTSKTVNRTVSTRTTKVNNNYYGYGYRTAGNIVATPIFGATFLPNTVFGWLILILVIVAIILVGHRLISDRN